MSSIRLIAESYQSQGAMCDPVSMGQRCSGFSTTLMTLGILKIDIMPWRKEVRVFESGE